VDQRAGQHHRKRDGKRELVVQRKEMLMFNLRAAVVVGLLLTAYAASPPPARAAVPLEFEFTGVYTAVGPGVQHHVGDQFTTTVRFDPDTPDTNPSPLRGEYRYLTWTAPSSTQTPFEFTPLADSYILVDREDPTHNWVVDYRAPLFTYTLRIAFPAGTFMTDALPQTLNLSISTDNQFNAVNNAVFPPGPILQGRITALTVRQVPEPAIWIAAPAGVFALLRRRRIRD
jgi:hypothetical protein